MKILMSGMTTRTVGSSRLKINYINFSPCLKAALEEMGHEVDQRRVTWGEDLSGYEAAFLHVTPLDKIVCQNIPEICYALDSMRDRSVLYLEDWIACEFKQSALHTMNNRWRGWMGWKYGTALPPDQEVMVLKVVREIITDCPWPVIANFFAWGDPRSFFEENFATERCSLIDPSSMAVLPPVENRMVAKAPQWVLAALQKHDKWVETQGFTWPVVRYGNMRSGQKVITEKEVARAYGQSWGVLAPRYPVRGWFRPRFLLAANEGSVLYCDESEGKLLGDAYTVPLKHIEEMTVGQLVYLANRQREQLERKVWSKGRLFSELDFLLEHLRERV